MEEKNREEKLPPPSSLISWHCLSDNLLPIYQHEESQRVQSLAPGKWVFEIFNKWVCFFSTTSFLVLSSTPHLPNESAAWVDMSHCSASIWSVLLTRSAPTCDNTLLSITSGLSDGLWLYLDTVIPNLPSTPNRYHFHSSLGSKWC